MPLKNQITLLTACVLLLVPASMGGRPSAGEASPKTHELKPTPKTVSWGYYDASRSRCSGSSRATRSRCKRSSPAARRGWKGRFCRPTRWSRPSGHLQRSEGQGAGRAHPHRAHLHRRGRAGRYPRGAHQENQAGHSLRLQRLWPRSGLPSGGLRSLADEDHPARREAHGRASSPRGSRSRCGRSSAAWGWRRRRKPAASAAARPAFTPAISTTRSWSRARRCSSPSTCARRCSRSATATPPRATAKSTSRPWKPRCRARFSSSSAKT